MRDILGKIGVSVLGLLQGTLGNYLGILGYCFAFPDTSPDCLNYEEDMFFVPLGYVLMLLCLIFMVIAVVLLRKNKSSLLTYLISCFAATVCTVIFVLYIR